MNSALWNQILQFDFDSPPSEYGFSTRLASENYWTKSFTEQAILEYKKFMYLAATSDLMVSPSEIIDTVWHQHLIFTQSYQEFCNILGKQIQHIPSTHNKQEFEKFRAAKERTKTSYANTFGEQPANIWEYSDMYESLHLAKAKWKIRSFALMGVFAFIMLTVPFYFVLKPLYVHINNPYFIFGYLGLIIATLITLEFINRYRLQQIVNEFDKRSFIYNLHPFELVYLKTQKLHNVVNGVVNELIEGGAITVNTDHTMQMSGKGAVSSMEQLQVMNVLHSTGRTYYPAILRQLATKPVFGNTANAMNAFKKYFNKSEKFGKLFYINFGVLALVLMLGFTRMATGMMRDRPVSIIVMVVVLLFVIIIFFLERLRKLTCIRTIPRLYTRHILPARKVEADWQWTYFLLGTAALTSSFVPVVTYVDRNGSSEATSTGASCGSSCGSSCSSCGGCGGGD
jgi:uncharacterized protein (TIGR04222 family)